MKYITAFAIYTAFLGLYVSVSGAPIRVHLVSAIALSIGFLLPALLVRDRKELNEKKKVILGLIVSSIFVLSFLNSLVIGKAEFIGELISMLPFGIVGLGALIVAHTLIIELLNRKVEIE